uniref:Uncharacterized protein n=1 Tax=Rhipicephalus pulchellus TaxID=72859 RepID=L7LY52_RHIPC
MTRLRSCSLPVCITLSRDSCSCVTSCSSLDCLSGRCGLASSCSINRLFSISAESTACLSFASSSFMVSSSSSLFRRLCLRVVSECDTRLSCVSSWETFADKSAG